MSDPLRVLIVDDEPVAGGGCDGCCARSRDVAVAGECGDGATALDMIRELSPDIVLLDVQMPELDGFALLQAMSPEEIPVVIFVTAYDQYALRAFEVHALDYVLKPVEAERLATAISRAECAWKKEGRASRRSRAGAHRSARTRTKAPDPDPGAY